MNNDTMRRVASALSAIAEESECMGAPLHAAKARELAARAEAATTNGRPSAGLKASWAAIIADAVAFVQHKASAAAVDAVLKASVH